MRGRAGGGSWRTGLVALVGLTGVACDVRPQSPAANCPPCECKCNCEAPATGPGPVSASVAVGGAGSASGSAGGPAIASGPVSGPAIASGPVSGPAIAGGPLQPVPPMAPDVGELVTAATRKLMHDDGAGCLADLDRVAAIDAKLDLRLAATRGQCEMLVGQCQQGKERIARWYETDAGMLPERAMITAEQIGSMRCREGDSSERDRLLRAYFDLSDGAYMNRRSPEFCKTALATARELIPRVKPRAPDDGQITGGAQALFHTAASCFARAGDCKAAWSTYRELFPQTATAAEAAAMMPQVIRESYDSSILFCGAKQREAPIPQSPPQRR